MNRPNGALGDLPLTVVSVSPVRVDTRSLVVVFSHEMEISPRLLRPIYVNLFDILVSAQLGPERRVYARDMEGRFIYANESFARDAGVPAERLLGGIDELCDWHERAEAIREEDRNIILRGHDHYRTKKLMIDGQDMEITLRKAVIYDASLNVCGIVGISHHSSMCSSKWRICSDCQAQTVRGLDLALQMLTDEQKIEWRRRISGDRGGDEAAV